MARIIYALSGEGRGHTSRVLAISAELRRRGHQIQFCCGGTALPILEGEGEDVIPVPALRQVMHGNRFQLVQTMLQNGRHLIRIPSIVRDLANVLSEKNPDLLITDFEAFSPRAAKLIGLPILSFNHQQVLTETRYHLRFRFSVDAFLARQAINRIAPKDPLHLLLTSFYFPPLKDARRATLVSPIIRPAVQNITPVKGEHVLVYYNQTTGAENVLEALRQVKAQFIVYNFRCPEPASAYPNIQFKEPSLDEFLADLATSRAVLCTAGFTLMSEALYLGKPLLVVPNSGIFEQTLNALFLMQDGLGEAVLDRPLTADDVRGFLSRLSLYEARLHGRNACGNDEAIACIERVLDSLSPESTRPSDDSQSELPALSIAKPE